MTDPCVDGTYFTVDPMTGTLSLVPGSMGLRRVQRYTQAGTHQFEKASYPWLARIVVEVQAPGGGSGGARSVATGEHSASAGGGGGAYSKSIVEASQLSAVETVILGAPGAAGTPTTAGGNGGDSSFGSWCSAPGGPGAINIFDSGSEVRPSSGTPGALPGAGNILARGGGPGLGPLRINGNFGVSGQGGDAFYGGGGIGRSVNGQGGSGNGYGSGAGGSNATNGNEFQGVEGQPGIIIVYMYG